MEYVQVRHEEMAAFMASAHAKFTGQVGLCYATSGPGAIHLLNGLYDAKLDHVPVVALVGQQARSALGASYQQEVDLSNLFADVTEYVGLASVPEQVRHLIRSRGEDCPHQARPSPALFCQTTFSCSPTRIRQSRTARRTPASAMRGPQSCRMRLSFGRQPRF